MVVTWPREFLDSGMNDINVQEQRLLLLAEVTGGKMAGNVCGEEVDICEMFLKNYLDKD